MKVSIIIPTLDSYRDGYFDKTLAAASNQEGFTLGLDFEILIQEADQSLGKNINEGLKRAQGKYIKICPDDDLLTPNCLKDLYEKAEEGFDFVCADAVNFSEGGEEIFASHIPKTVAELALDNSIHGGTVLFRRAVMPPYDEGMWTAEEYEHALRMASYGLRFGYTPKVVFKYRLHGAQKSGFWWQSDNKKKLSRYEYIDAMRSKYLTNNKLINGH